MGTTSGECMVALAAESATGNVSPCKGVVSHDHTPSEKSEGSGILHARIILVLVLQEFITFNMNIVGRNL